MPTKSGSIIKLIRLYISVSLLISFLIHICTIYTYLNMVSMQSSLIFDESIILIPLVDNKISLNLFSWKFNLKNPFYFSIDLFGLFILFLAYIIGFFSLMALDTRLYWKNIGYYFSFNTFTIVVFLLTSTTNVVIFFLLYECLLIPSFLFVYFVSPSRRAIQASLYFVIWTQVGSFLVLLVIAYMVSISGCYDFVYLRTFKFTNFESVCMYLLLFLGFGFKIPIWPFHFWLTKTHVEAPSGFSIYLSGFLVKSALYGFYKLSNLFDGDINTTFFISICLIGVLDASLKMWGQTDLKKLVAYGTIQEMNLIYLVFCWGDVNGVVGGILFSVTHAFLSALMFFIVDCFYRRYKTRSFVEINGILHFTPNLAISIFFMCIFFGGIPGTIKFVVEFYIFGGFLDISPFLCLFLMFISNVFGLVGFSKCWFNATFGMNTKKIKYIPLDLTIKELYIIVFCHIFLMMFSFFPSFLF